MSSGLFNRAGVRYEVACEMLGAIISHHAEVLGLENSKAIADPTVVVAAQTAISEINQLRDGLDPKDSAAVESLIAKYRPLARQLNKA